MSATLRRAIGIFVVLGVVVCIVVLFLDEPLRVYAEQAFNGRVAGVYVGHQEIRFSSHWVIG